LPPQFDTSVIPWWAWVRRFHLPQAEQINGRAAVHTPQHALYCFGWIRMINSRLWACA
jgi:hypothetical protein